MVANRSSFIQKIFWKIISRLICDIRRHFLDEPVVLITSFTPHLIEDEIQIVGYGHI